MKPSHIIAITLLSVVGLLFAGCKKEPATVIVKEERGYNCENFSCTFVESGAQYLTLLDCKSECADNRPGHVDITVTAGSKEYSNNYTLTISLGISAEDVAIGAFFLNHKENGSFYANQNKTFFLAETDLSPGTYYYQIILKQPVGLRSKTDRFIVKPTETTKVEIAL